MECVWYGMPGQWRAEANRREREWRCDLCEREGGTEKNRLISARRRLSCVYVGCRILATAAVGRGHQQQLQLSLPKKASALRRGCVCCVSPSDSASPPPRSPLAAHSHLVQLDTTTLKRPRHRLTCPRTRRPHLSHPGLPPFINSYPPLPPLFFLHCPHGQSPLQHTPCSPPPPARPSLASAQHPRSAREPPVSSRFLDSVEGSVSARPRPRFLARA